jgi:hypothetical protein
MISCELMLVMEAWRGSVRRVLCGEIRPWHANVRALSNDHALRAPVRPGEWSGVLARPCCPICGSAGVLGMRQRLCVDSGACCMRGM